MKKQLQQPFIVIALFLIGFLIMDYFEKIALELMTEDNVINISTKYSIISAFNILYTLISYWLIKKYKLIDLAGLGKHPLKNWFLLLFPLYIVLLNLPDPGEIDFSSISMINYIVAVVWVLSIGFSEEYMLRGFIQSILLKYYSKSKTKLVLSVVGAAMIFGVLHLVKFDKGIYGEISQVLYATFIGTMFGALLLRTHKIWPLIILHALIDLSGNLEYFQSSQIVVNMSSQSQASLEDSMVNVLILLPCFIYGLFLLRKVKVEDAQTKIES